MKYIKFLWIFFMCCNYLPGMQRFANICAHFKKISFINPRARLLPHKITHFHHKIILGGSTTLLATSESEINDKNDRMVKDKGNKEKLKFEHQIVIKPDRPVDFIQSVLGGLSGTIIGGIFGACAGAPFRDNVDTIALGGSIIGCFIGAGIGRSLYWRDRKYWNEFVKQEFVHKIKNQSINQSNGFIIRPKLPPEEIAKFKLSLIDEKPPYPIIEPTIGAIIGFYVGLQIKVNNHRRPIDPLKVAAVCGAVGALTGMVTNIIDRIAYNKEIQGKNKNKPH